ncbi:MULTISPECIES: DsbA family protein [Frankia]|nr:MULTISPECIES: thioredoxin domain-containing protein [Frankia]
MASSSKTRGKGGNGRNVPTATRSAGRSAASSAAGSEGGASSGDAVSSGGAVSSEGSAGARGGAGTRAAAGPSSAGAAGGGSGPARRGKAGAEDRRAKAAAARAAAAAQERRRRNLIVAGVVVVVLIVAGVIGFAVQNSREESKPVVLPATATGRDNGIIVGQASAPVTVDLYEDFQCPACGALETQTGPTIRALLDQGKIKIDYHMMSFLGPESKRAANAAAAAANEGRFRQLHDVLYANQPEEKTGGFTNDTLLTLGAKAGLTSQAYKDAVNNGTYDGYVAKVDSDASKAGVAQTPTVEIGGKQLSGTQLTPDGFRAAVTAAS